MPGIDARARLAPWLTGWWAGERVPAGTLAAGVLWPAELAYCAATRMRNAAYDRGWARTVRAPLPVISVGNLTVGGAGKTPVAAWLAERLLERGERPAVLLRGYGRDEVLVHYELNPGVSVLAGRDRVESARRAAASGCTVAILDDGFQHRRLARDLDILLVASESLRGPRRLLPRGPWREELAATRRAGLVMITSKASGPSVLATSLERKRLLGDRELVECRILPDHLQSLHEGEPLPLDTLRGRSVLAVAALASPRTFARNLSDAGAEVELAAFPDHHEFTQPEADSLQARAEGRALVMTLKDAVKLRSRIQDGTLAFVLRQRVELGSGQELLEAALQRALQGRAA